MEGKKCVGILTSGGDAPGMNAAIRAVTRAAIYNGFDVKGIMRGYKGLITDEIIPFQTQNVSNIIQQGGTILKTARCEEFRTPEGRKIAYDNIIKHGISALVVIGGDGSLTGARIFASEYNFPIVGVPGTIDNDLFGTDHCPGYASAAKYVATTCMEIYRDARVYDTGMVCVIEIMGRHAGWLTAASSLANISGEGPDLIYLPERDFDLNKFVEDVKAVYARSGKCIAAVSEGIHDSTGKLIAEYGAENAPVDAFGHKQLGGLASYLANYIKGTLGCKVRGIEFSLMQRCGAHLASLTDIQESFLSGKTAVLEAISGTTDKMVGFERKYDEKGSYVCGIKLMDLTDVANTEKKVPLEWINREGNNVNKEFIDYALPLIQGTPDRPLENGLPRFARLKKVFAK